MKLFACSGIALSLGLIASVSFAQDYSPRMDSAYQRAQVNYQQAAAGSRYRSARTAFRMNLQDAEGSDTGDSLPTPSDATKAGVPDQEVIGSSRVKSTTAASGCDSPSYVDYGGFGTASCDGGGFYDSLRGRIHGLFGGKTHSLFGGGPSCDSGECGPGGGGLCGSHIGCGGWNDGAAFGAGCWYGGIYGLVMTREDNYGQSLNYDSAYPSSSLFSTNRANDEYYGGVEARFGKSLSCSCAIEGVYWGLYPANEQCDVQQAYLGGDLRTSLGFNNLAYNNGALTAPVAQFYGDATRTAQAHRIRSSYEVHNAEINFVKTPVTSCCSKFDCSFLAGVRYFKFDDGLSFSTDYRNTVWGDSLADELHYDVDVDNNLLGFQLGSRMNYRLCHCFSLNAGANFGVYNNHITQMQRIRGGNGYAYDVNTGEDYYLQSSDDDLAFLGDISLGLAYDICCNWRLNGGYRLTAASGIANATGQIPRDRDFYNYDRVRDIDSQDSLVLHGAFFGVEHTW